MRDLAAFVREPACDEDRCRILNGLGSALRDRLEGLVLLPAVSLLGVA